MAGHWRQPPAALRQPGRRPAQLLQEVPPTHPPPTPKHQTPTSMCLSSAETTTGWTSSVRWRGWGRVRMSQQCLQCRQPASALGLGCPATAALPRAHRRLRGGRLRGVPEQLHPHEGGRLLLNHVGTHWPLRCLVCRAKRLHGRGCCQCRRRGCFGPAQIAPCSPCWRWRVWRVSLRAGCPLLLPVGVRLPHSIMRPARC